MIFQRLECFPLSDQISLAYQQDTPGRAPTSPSSKKQSRPITGRVELWHARQITVAGSLPREIRHEPRLKRYWREHTIGLRGISNEAQPASYRFLNLSRKSLEASDRVIFLTRMPSRPLSKSDLRTGFEYPVLNTRSQTPLVIPYPISIPRGLW